MDRDRYRDERHRWDYGEERRARPRHEDDRRRSPDFRDRPGREPPRGGCDWSRDEFPGDPPAAYGVGADAAYGAPADDRYSARRYRSHDPQRSREDADETEWERTAYAPDTRPGYIEPVPGQISEGGFWAESLAGPSRGRLTGEELRRYQHHDDPDYVSWRDDQLRAHDRDYQAWREERRRSYDDDYGKWRRERQEKFGQDFSDWRSQRGTAPESAQRGLPPDEVDKSGKT